jgi:hypothetical protein
VEIVAAFVDEDLAWVVGIAYWYAYASIFANQLVEAAGLSSYWGLATIWQSLGFYALAPIVIIGINLCGVKVSPFAVIHSCPQGIDKASGLALSNLLGGFSRSYSYLDWRL